MLGRGVDQILPHPSDPRIEESYLRDARDYVALAEVRSGPIPRAVAPSYVWGDALTELDRAAPDARIINLETSITRSEVRWPHKEIHYRMNPRNVSALSTACIDVCVLANNHVLDHGYPGLLETLETLQHAGIQAVGAGRTLEEALRPAVVPVPGGGRILVFAYGSDSSGVYEEWAATADYPGVAFLPDLSQTTLDEIVDQIHRVKRERDVVVVSLHWGSNWGYAVPESHVRFAHALVDAGVDVVHGHSSHHPRPLEVYRGRLILYGCGDFISDYEGITGYEEFRGHLSLMYLVDVDLDSGALRELRMVPMRLQKLQVVRASEPERDWLAAVLDRHSRWFGTRVERTPDGQLTARAATTRPTLERPSP